ncbi:Bacterial membrane flanked domain protein [Jeotgalicoccus saudimassiliensis]|uniref:Bacterial membrane flanked domain protein n=1 Tax=Jeotgalicoccus saudimassiliensis TaxID=1461582 RepID=A0A078MFA0_9STAP|nr:PH domain-containing protein [Jeotgalicoccus saudimassiliensis]CEA03376.1 Bacterial membrane flanked domain protein [Jeotgalicoccus saudimassiliensis]
MIELNKHVRPYMTVKALLIWVTSILIFAAAGIAVHFFSWPVWLYYIFAGLLVLELAGYVFLRPLIYTKVTSYELLADRIIVRQGFFTVKTQMIPIKRAQGVEFKTGPLSRKYDLAAVRIKTAGLGINMPPLQIDEARNLKTAIIDIVKEENTDV